MPPGMAAKVGKSIQVNETLERMRDVLRGNKKVRVHVCVWGGGQLPSLLC